MGNNGSGSGRGRVLAIVVSVVVSAGMVYAQTNDAPQRADSAATAPATGSDAAADAPIDLGAGPPVDVAAKAELLAASAPVIAQDYQVELPAGVAAEGGLQVKTIWTARAISVMFPEITTIGGYRQDPLPWHPNGLAIDVMIPNHNSAEGIALGNQIAGLALANARRWGVIHVIWRQGFYPGIGAPSWTADYGNETANHFDHVHIATNGGGYPTGDETYFLGSMKPAPSN
ncbi:glycoside hydrolase [Mycolicibacterium sp.]|uniref:glycoside hydrolase n=1 Tax=Mycolicibacterium sp. TaxID=2320850 RepID=UPI003D0EE6C7